MKNILAGAFSVGVFAMTARVAARHAQVIDIDSQGKSAELAKMFALRESIEDFPLPIESGLSSKQASIFSSRKATTESDETSVKIVNLFKKKPALQM